MQQKRSLGNKGGAMSYSESEARRLVIEAGHALAEKRLIARTWGNISARISDEEFIITPSGREYENMWADELVKVRISDCSYEGNIKPSGETGIHAEAYAQRSSLNFVLHTHQPYASAVCAEGKDTVFAPCAKYALPGTKKLRNNVGHCYAAHPAKKAFLMEKHGAVVLGDSYEDAFSTAAELELFCKNLWEKRTGIKAEADGSGLSDLSKALKAAKKAVPGAAWLDDYAQLVGFGGKADEEDKEAVAMITEKNNLAAIYVINAKPISVPEKLLQRIIYLGKYSKLKDNNKQNSF